VLVIVVLRFGVIDRQESDPVTFALHERLLAHRGATEKGLRGPQGWLGPIRVRAFIARAREPSRERFRRDPQSLLEFDERERFLPMDELDDTVLRQNKGRWRIDHVDEPPGRCESACLVPIGPTDDVFKPGGCFLL
jgi:hypothetical protein